MSRADPQSTSANETESSSSSPAWLKSWEERINEEREDIGDTEVYFEIIRDLLLAPTGDEKAIADAVESLHKHYIAGFSDEDFGVREPPEYGAGLALLAVSEAVFEAMEFISFEDPKHDRLADFIIALKATAASEFDINNPQFVFYPAELGAATQRAIDQRVSGRTQYNDTAAVKEHADQWLNAEAMLSKLFKAELLEEYGPLWVTSDFRTAFEKNSDIQFANIGRQAEAFAPVNHILIAGEALLQEFKNPPQKRWYDLSKETWKKWASKLQEVADVVAEDVPWQLKTRAQLAHDKMVELYPEAFKDDAPLSGTA